MTATTTFIVFRGDDWDTFLEVEDENKKPYVIDATSLVYGALIDYDTNLSILENSLSSASPANWAIGKVYFPLTSAETDARADNQKARVRIRIIFDGKTRTVEGEGFLHFVDDHFTA